MILQKNYPVLSVTFNSGIGVSDIISIEKEAEELAEMFHKNCSWQLYVLLFDKLRTKYADVNSMNFDIERELEEAKASLAKAKAKIRPLPKEYTIRVYDKKSPAYTRNFNILTNYTYTYTVSARQHDQNNYWTKFDLINKLKEYIGTIIWDKLVQLGEPIEQHITSMILAYCGGLISDSFTIDTNTHKYVVTMR
jgi:hypothetical protein